MWLCVMKAIELQSPWCTPGQQKEEDEGKGRERDESGRHGPGSQFGAEHHRARFMMI
jgi:hypothetical protein